MTKWKIYNEDAVEWAKNYQKGKFHALLCDAPYHLTSVTKRFGKKDSAPAKFGTDGVFSRSARGFMGTQWDGGDLAFRPETWDAFGQVLYPGAFGMAFSASRNWHRMAVAIEGLLSISPNSLLEQADILAYARETKDWNLVESVELWIREQAGIKSALQVAGFILHPTIFLWAYGQGFPKATRIDTQIDNKEGNIRKDKLMGGRMFDAKEVGDHKSSSFELKNKIPHVIGKGAYNNGTPISEIAKAWESRRYGLQALKPAVEPIIVFQKPYEGKPLDNIVDTGAGALNINGGRIPVSEPVTINRFTDGAKPWGDAKGEEFDTVLSSQGRWPANLILEQDAAQALDAQTGNLKSGTNAIRTQEGSFLEHGGLGKAGDVQVTYGDDGGASRFFYCVQDKLDESDPVYYCAKVSPKERNAGLDDLPDKQFAQSGGAQSKLSQGEDEYKQDSIESNRISTRKNIHPTVKPIDLCRYLATLLLPPDEYAPRRIFVPFSGSGSEMIGAGLAGWEHVVGVEFDKENGYVDIAEKRLEHWLK